MYIMDILAREFTEILLFSEEIYGKIFVQASEGLAKMFLARVKRAQSSFFYALSKSEATMLFVFFLLFLPCNFL